MALEAKNPENIEGVIALEKQKAREKFKPLIDLVNSRYRSPESTFFGKENLINSLEAHNSEVLDSVIELGIRKGLGGKDLCALEISSILHDIAKGDPAPQETKEVRNFVLVNHHEAAAAEVESILKKRHPEILGLVLGDKSQSSEEDEFIKLIKNAIICHMGPNPGFMAERLDEVNEELSRKGLSIIAHPEPNDEISRYLLAADMRSLATPLGVQKIMNLRSAQFSAEDEKLCEKFKKYGIEISVPEAAFMSAFHSALDAIDMVKSTCGKEEIRWLRSTLDSVKQSTFSYIKDGNETKVSYEQVKDRMLWDLPPAGKTGVTGDYWNAFMVLASVESPEEWEERGLEYSKECYKRSGSVIEKFEDHYSPDRYNFRKITEDAKRRIERLNEIIDEINQLYQKDEFAREEVLKLFNEAHKLIYGD